MEKNFISFRSPKNKYRAEINYKPALDFGSVESMGAMNLGNLKLMVARLAEQRRAECGSDFFEEIYVSIWRNEATYPEFDWKPVETYNI
jgi:hypothetical protein